MPLGDTGKRRRRAVGLLVPAIAAGLLGLGSFYTHAAYTHVSVTFKQRGLYGGGARIQIEVNCAGVYGTATAAEDETVNLNWLRRSDVITVEAAAGVESYSLHLYVDADGRMKSVLEVGQPENPIGVGGGKALVDESILYQSYQADGRKLINTGCPPARRVSSGSHGMQHTEPVPLALHGKPPPPPKAWYALPNLAFYVAADGWSILSWVLYLIGGFVVTCAFAQQAYTGGDTRTLRRAVLAALVAGIGTLLTILGLVEYLDGIRYAKDAVAGLTALAFAITGVWLLRQEIAQAVTRFEKTWAKE